MGESSSIVFLNENRMKCMHAEIGLTALLRSKPHGARLIKTVLCYKNVLSSSSPFLIETFKTSDNMELLF